MRAENPSSPGPCISDEGLFVQSDESELEKAWRFRPTHSFISIDRHNIFKRDCRFITVIRLRYFSGMHKVVTRSVHLLSGYRLYI
jgi:hypothetical protein